MNSLVEAQNEVSCIAVQVSVLMRQKTRIKWVKEGATNTSFFHTNLKIRQDDKQISELENLHGNWKHGGYNITPTFFIRQPVWTKP